MAQIYREGIEMKMYGVKGGSPMNVRNPQYMVVSSNPMALTIKDVGPWEKHMTVTNAAEVVVDELFASGLLKEGQRLLYYDSEEQLDEILIEKRAFAGFAPYERLK